MTRLACLHDVSLSILRSCTALCLVALLPDAAQAQADLFMRDRPPDTGVEPYAGPGPIYASEDVWVRNDPDPNYSPYPFPTGTPTWTPLPHQNPEYRDTPTGQPNYIYVLVSNRGDQPSTGAERLRVYQAKASTGLAWPANWVDYMDVACGQSVLHAIEVTKPRRNAKLVSQPERDAYIAALNDINTDTLLRYADGVQYWRKQNQIHAGFGNPQHGNPAFLPWHREMVNRFEAHLKESDPLVTLLYWDWTEDPRFGATNLFTTSFMGASSGSVGAPLTPLQPPTLTRDVASVAFSPSADATLAALPDYDNLAEDVEETPNYNSAHGFIGGFFGQISSLSTAAQDPFFFQLHGNVDRLWANWQRNPAQPGRIDPVASYDVHSSNLSINATMSPWDGATGLAPWTTTPYNKTSKDHSVVYPPIYDTAPLNVPILAPGESVIVEIPWFPPNVADFNCQGQSGHFCLLARIETSQTAPFGMTFPEGSNVGTNTRNNNNIVWKNLTVVDDVPELVAANMTFTTGTLLRNVFERDVEFVVGLRDRTPRREGLVFEAGRISLTLPADIAERVLERPGERLRGIEATRDEATGNPVFLAAVEGAELTVPLRAGEQVPVAMRAEFPAGLARELRAEPFFVDIEQAIVQPSGQFVRLNEEQTLIGGVRFAIDLASIKLVEEGSEWMTAQETDILTAEDLPGERAFGSVDTPLRETVTEAPARVLVKRFTVGDPDAIETLRLSVMASEGVAVFVNGKEVLRRNLPDGELAGEIEPRGALGPLEAQTTSVEEIDPAVLHSGQNVIAALVVGRREGEIAFDLALTANDVAEGIAPDLLLSVGDTGRTHFAPGEPIPVTLLATDQDGGLEQVMLRLDGEMELRAAEGTLRDAVRIEEPGVHTLEAVAIDRDGQRTTRQMRVLVSANIPPNVSIASPSNGATVPVGEPVEVAAEVQPAFARDIDRVALYVKEGDRISTGLNLVENEAYPAVDETQEAPYRLTFRPEEPGMYMLQLGAVDDAGVTGVSRHVHIHVH